MIPKMIHYCWFGRNPKPKLARRCIRSWGKYCGDYQIIEWNEDNFDISSAPLYVRQAYEAKKWAFVTDYVRLWALTAYGGIYMDTDVEVTKPLDRFLEHEAFSGFEDDIHIATCIMACRKGFLFFEELLHEYDTAEFIDRNGNMNLKTNVVFITEYCTEHGFVPDNRYQIFQDMALYPKDYFCPKDYHDGKIRKTDNTHTIHHFNGSWLSEEARAAHRSDIKKLNRFQRTRGIVLLTRRMLGEKAYGKLRKLCGRP